MRREPTPPLVAPDEPSPGGGAGQRGSGPGDGWARPRRTLRGRAGRPAAGHNGGAIARVEAVIDRAPLDRMPALRVIARHGVGVEQADRVTAEPCGIPVVATPGTGTQGVAPGTIAMALGLLKRHRAPTELVREGRWAERSAVVPGALEGAVPGIIAYGRIGRR